jgi:hypothetical protein
MGQLSVPYANPVPGLDAATAAVDVVTVVAATGAVVAAAVVAGTMSEPAAAAVANRPILSLLESARILPPAIVVASAT